MIAAGEVVEGPHSVIKELVENSLDASSTSIEIEVEESGFKRIFVRDDGEGMYKEDIPKAVMEHATSKIRTIDDIQGILSFGFRGEALSSISAVSSVTILSRRDDEQIGGKISNAAGSFLVTDFAGARGTTVIVENLFYNTPARKKFMKSQSAESRVIKETVIHAALAHPETGFTLIINGSSALKLSSCESMGERIEQLFGNEEFKSLAHESVTDIHVSIEGFLSRPHHSKGTRGMQYLFVNGRPVEMKSLGFLLSRAYESAVSHGRYPAAVLFISIRPDLVDVNIHPAKREIKFFDQHHVEQLITGLAKKILGSKEQTVFASDFNRQHFNESVQTEDRNFETSDPASVSVAKRTEIFKEFAEPVSSPERRAYSEQSRFLFSVSREAPVYEESAAAEVLSDGARIIGTVFGTYIMAQIDQTLKIVDFHAAHERITYDSIIENEGRADRQELIFPEVIELSRSQLSEMRELLPFMEEQGFDAEEFSEDSIIIRAVPSLLKDLSVKDFIKDLIECRTDGSDPLSDKKHRVASRIACHASKRANDYLSKVEMQLLIDKVLSGKYTLTCPHGRPFLYSMDKSEFEKLFRR
jgi:DNA mismatch repair protein MutL